jgi:hypothetical protein
LGPPPISLQLNWLGSNSSWFILSVWVLACL